MSGAVASIEFKYLVQDRDRHGNVRRYVRIKGRPKIRLREEPGTQAFQREYDAAVAGPMGSGAPATTRPRRAPGTIGHLIQHYERSSDYKDLEASTKAVRKRLLDRIDQKVGAFKVRDLRPIHVKKWRDAPDGPEAGNAIVKTLRCVFATAIEDELAADNPALAVRYRKGNPAGHTPWNIGHVAQYVRRHPPGSRAYLALCLFLFTGARLSDARRMGPQHERQGGTWLNFTQHKGRNRNPIVVDVPVIKPLREAIDACPSNQMAYMVTEFGTPFKSDKSFGNWMAKRIAEAGLEGVSSHGIRKGLGDILAELGCSAHQIMAILGHTTLKQAEVYTRRANRKRMAGDGMEKLARAVEAENMLSLPAPEQKAK